MNDYIRIQLQFALAALDASDLDAVADACENVVAAVEMATWDMPDTLSVRLKNKQHQNT